MDWKAAFASGSGASLLAIVVGVLWGASLVAMVVGILLARIPLELSHSIASGHPRRARALLRLRATRWGLGRRWLHLYEAWALFWDGSFARSLAITERAIAGTRRATQASLVRGACLVFLDRPDDARALLAPLLDGVRAVGDGRLVRPRAQALCAILSFRAGDLPASQAALQPLERRFGSRDPWRALVRFYLAAIAYRMGRIDDCHRLLSDVLLASDELAVVRWAIHAHAELLPQFPLLPRPTRRQWQPLPATGLRLLLQDLRRGVCYPFARRVAIRRAYSYPQIALLLVANLVCIALLHSLEYVRGGHLLTYGAATALVPLGLFVPSAYMMARILRPRMDPARLAGALLSALPLLAMLEYLCGRLVHPYVGEKAFVSLVLVARRFAPVASTVQSLAALLGIWAVATISRRVAPGAGFFRVATAVALFVIAWMTPTVEAGELPVWGPHVDAAEETYDDSQKKLATFLYGQADAVRDAEAALLPERPGVADLYFVGSAPWGRQDVFLHEARYAKDLFDSRFDTHGRSIVLVDDPEARPASALPTKRNLLHVIGAVGSKMNPEEDMLFLFVTSHGSAEGVGLSLSDAHPWLADEQILRPSELRVALDEAHIKWRVVVVSACMAGVFVDALRNDGTIILTAASTDRLSFGCTNGADFTEFGRALFHDELTHEASFPAAFADTIRLVHEREIEQNRTPSLPQLYVGPAIGEKLHAYEERLALERASQRGSER